MLVADRAVGQEHDLAQAPGQRRLVQRPFERRLHLGAALGFEGAHIGLGMSQVPLVRGLRHGEQRAGRAVEADDVEAVAGLEAVEGEDYRLFGLLDRAAVHRARGIDHEDQVARRARPGIVAVLDGLGRQQADQQVAVAVDLLGEDRGLRLRTHGRSPFQQKIAVGWNAAVGQGDQPAARGGLFDRNRMVETRDLFQGQPRIQRDA